MAMENVQAKFHECTEFSGLYSTDESNEIISTIMELDESESITPLIDKLSSGA